MDTGCLHDVLAGALDEVAYDSLIVFSCDEWGIDLGWRSTWGGCRPRCAAIQIDAVLLVRPQLDCLATMHRNGPSSSVPFGEWIRRDDVANRCDWFSHVEGARRAGVRRVAVRHIGDPLSEFAMALADVADVLAPEVRGSELPLDGPAPPDLAAMLAAVDRLVAEKDPSVLAGNLRVSLQQVGAALDDHLGRVETDSLDDEDRLWVRQRFDEANSNLRRYLKATEAL
jgi:hypothetical protein